VLPAPLLSSIHSGVPERLVAESDRAKRLLYSNKTLPTSVPRRRGVPLPPDVSQTAFDTAIAELRQTLGDSNIELNDKPLVDGWYLEHPNTHDAFHISEQEELVCSAVVYPSTTAEVQSIARWANQHKIPIYPISMGRNVGYGGAAPRVPGSVVVDLGR